MSQSLTLNDFPLLPTLVRAVTHRMAPLVALLLVVVVALIAAVVVWGLVALTLTATVAVPIIFILLIGFAQP